MVAVAGSGWRLAPCLVACVNELDRLYPQRDHTSDGSIGDLSHQARTSDHNPDGGFVCAVDLDEDLSQSVHSMMPAAERWRTLEDPRVKYVIYEGRIFKGYTDSAGHDPWEWYPYTGVNDHSHHLHLSVWNTEECRNDLRSWGFALAFAPKPDPVPVEDDEMAAFELWRDSRDNKLYRVASSGQSKVWIRTSAAKNVDYYRQGSAIENKADRADSQAWLDSVPTVS